MSNTPANPDPNQPQQPNFQQPDAQNQPQFQQQQQQPQFQQQPQQQFQQPGYFQPQKQGMSTAAKVLIGLGIFFVLFIGGCAALIAVAGNTAVNELDEVSNEISDISNQMEEDAALVEQNATITSCATDEFSGAIATVEFTSPFDEKKDSISVEVNFKDGEGTVVGSGTAFFENLGPGEKAISDATAFSLAGENVSGLTCEIANGSAF